MRTTNTMRRGQAMILTILAIGGAILGATAVAGLLTLYEIRASTDAARSAQAIFAADAGISWSEFDYYCGLQNPTKCVQAGAQPMPVFSPGILASTTVSCTDASSTATPCDSTSTAVSAVSKGFSLEAVRAFQLNIAAAMGTVP